MQLSGLLGTINEDIDKIFQKKILSNNIIPKNVLGKYFDTKLCCNKVYSVY